MSKNIQEKATEIFQKRYSMQPQALYKSPGRVNLIGEHTDYNDGWVLPMAIDMGTYFAVGTNNQARLRIYSADYDENFELPMQLIREQSRKNRWFDYFVGVLHQTPFTELSQGLDVVVKGNLPIGAGLSSSASVTTGFSYLLNQTLSLNMTPLEIAQCAQQVENDYVGVACGILDPFAIVMSKENHVTALNCKTMDWKRVEFDRDKHTILIANTNVPRELVNSAFNDRRVECEQALEIISKHQAVTCLSDLSQKSLDECNELRAQPTLYKRAKHVVSENERVKMAASALESGDLQLFGKLLTESHYSLRNDYEVSCDELNILVDEAVKFPGVLGAKMTGAGFGGCAVIVVETGDADELVDELSRVYHEKSGRLGEFYQCSPANGVSDVGIPYMG